MNQHDPARDLHDPEPLNRADELLAHLDVELGEDARAQILNSDDLYHEAGLPR